MVAVAASLEDKKKKEKKNTGGLVAKEPAGELVAFFSHSCDAC